MNLNKEDEETIKKIFEDLHIEIEEGSIQKENKFVIAKELITKKQIVLLYFKNTLDSNIISEFFLTVAKFNAEIVILIVDYITKNTMRVINWLNNISNDDTKFILERNGFCN